MQAAQSPRPVMLGDGVYDRHSTLQAGVVRLAAPELDRAVGTLPPATPEQPLCLADYLSATGKNAIGAMGYLEASIGRRQAAPTPLAMWRPARQRLESARRAPRGRLRGPARRHFRHAPA